MSLTVSKNSNNPGQIWSQSAQGEIDTSLLFNDLCQEYQHTGSHIEVDFRKLVGWVRSGDQITHQIHPYPAKLLPNIAHFFTRASLLHKSSHVVLDPFCGSGTVALEASMAGHVPYVADANPLALLITKVKTTSYDPHELRLATRSIITHAKRYRTAPEVKVVNDSLWYMPDRKRQLEILLRAVMELEDEAHRDFFRVCFSVTARKLSMADPAISVPVRLKTKDSFKYDVNERIQRRLDWIRVVETTAEFGRICEANIERVEAANNANMQRKSAIVVGTDVRQLREPHLDMGIPLKDESVPLIVTSPPYGSAQKYIRATCLSLNWLGLADPNSLTNLEGKSIGREHVPSYRECALSIEFPKEYEQLLNRIKIKNKTREAITRYYLYEMQVALSEMVRVTSKGGRIVLVVGNNQVCGETMRNDKYITHVMQELGLSLELSLVDQIKSRGLMTKRNKTASMISLESVLVFIKK
jgi:tRNA G10  N-methylase Trm11